MKNKNKPNPLCVVHQTTLNSAIGCSGIALHYGGKVSLTLKPAEAGHGIVFKRTDIKGGGAEIPARWDKVVATAMCTTLGNGDGLTISTVEHLMAAFAGCRIDNAVVEVNGPEVPIMDGSAQPFVFLIECAGIKELDTPRRVIRVKKAVSVSDGDGMATLIPGVGFSVNFEIDFNSAVVSRQSLEVGLFNGSFKKELARARTFGFLHDVERLRAAGFARGGSLDNAIVISGDKVLNEDGLRYDNEFVRHKALDAVGDLYLAGAPVLGRFHGVCSGHTANNSLLAALFADPDAWEYDAITAAEENSMPAMTYIPKTVAKTVAKEAAASA